MTICADYYIYIKLYINMREREICPKHSCRIKGFWVARSGRLCGVQFEELEATGTSQNEQCISTLARVPENLRIPQPLY